MTASNSTCYAINEPGLPLYQVDPVVPSTAIAAGVGISAEVGPTQALGTLVITNWGFVCYGVATATVNAGYLSYFYWDGTYAVTQAFGAVQMTSGAITTQPYLMGSPLATQTVGQFGWYWVGCGQGQLLCENSISAGTALYLGATTGAAAGSGTYKIGATPVNNTTAAVCVVSAPGFMYPRT